MLKTSPTLRPSFLDRAAQRIASLPRRQKRAILVAVDFVSLTVLVWVSFSLRLKEPFYPNLGQATLMFAAPVIAIPIFVRMGLYRSVLRYLPERAIWTIIQAVSLAVLGWVTLAFLSAATGLEGVPRSIPVAYWALATVFLVGSRFGMKWMLLGRAHDSFRAKRTLIYGAGEAGVQLWSALRSSHEREVLGFIGEDPALQGLDVMGLRVYPPEILPSLVSNMGVDELIIATSTSDNAERRRLFASLSSLPIKLRVLPPISDIASGRYLVSFVRDFDLDDLLGRSEVPADPELLKRAVDGKVILVTGAAGSIGSAVSHLVAGLSPAALVILDVNEFGLYQIDRQLRQVATFPILPVLGSVADRALLDRIMSQNAVDTVFHCAAYKHVSLVEANMLEGVRNNILGTATLAEAAFHAGVKNFVLISSDKAVRPVSVMGATKRWSELIVRHYGRKSSQAHCYSSVRFGNVIGSSGSVVPLFREQIANGGPVTITDDNMTRYFMSVREAAELIVQASALSTTGDILLLEMGDPVRIRDLAEDMIALAGLTVRDVENPGGDIEIVAIGARPGEKIHEELFYDRSGVTPTAHPKILRARRPQRPEDGIVEELEKLRQALQAADETAVRHILFAYVESVALGEPQVPIVAES